MAKIVEEKLKITPERHTELVHELDERIANQKIIATEIKEARDLGDLKENDPYTQAMRKKEINDARIDEISDLLDRAEVVDIEVSEDSIIEVGFKVEIKNVTNKTVRVITLVGKEETGDSDPREGKVSIDSPIGSGIYHKKLGDEFVIATPNGDNKYKITDIIVE